MIERFDPNRGRAVTPQYASQLHGAAQRSDAESRGFGEDGVGWENEYAEQVVDMAEMAAEAEAGADDMVSGDRPGRRGLSHWVGWAAAMVAVGVVVGGLIVLVMKFLNGPVEAKPGAKSLAQLQASAAPTPSTQVLGGQAVEFSYPSVFDQVRKMQDSVLDSYYLASKSESSRTIAVAVVALPSNRIDDDSGYKYRLLHAELYTQKREKINGEEVVIMTKKDRTEETLFWPHKGKSLNISITSTAPRDQVSEFMAVIKPTIRWRQ